MNLERSHTTAIFFLVQAVGAVSEPREVPAECSSDEVQLAPSKDKGKNN